MAEQVLHFLFWWNSKLSSKQGHSSLSVSPYKFILVGEPTSVWLLEGNTSTSVGHDRGETEPKLIMAQCIVGPRRRRTSLYQCFSGCFDPNNEFSSFHLAGAAEFQGSRDANHLPSVSLICHLHLPPEIQSARGGAAAAAVS